MKLIFLALIILIVVLIITSIVLYFRRLNRIAKGQERERHSIIPEPGVTLSIVYKTVLLIVVFAIFLLLKTNTNKIIEANNSKYQQLRNQIYQLEGDLQNIINQQAYEASPVQSAEYSIKEVDYDKLTLKLLYRVRLKEYNQDTAVALLANGISVPLSYIGDNTYEGDYDLAIFSDTEVSLTIIDGEKSYTQGIPYPKNPVRDAFPLPSISFMLNHKEFLGFIISYEGSYLIDFDNTDQITKVTATYYSDGNEKQTVDVTTDAKNHKNINVPDGVKFKKSLSVLIKIQIQSGHTVEIDCELIGPATSDDGERIFDASGRLLWSE